MTTKSLSSSNAKLSSKSTEVTIPVRECTVYPSLHDSHAHDTLATSRQTSVSVLLLRLLPPSTLRSPRPLDRVTLLKPIDVPSVAKSTRRLSRVGSSGYKFTDRRLVIECVFNERTFSSTQPSFRSSLPSSQD